MNPIKFTYQHKLVHNIYSLVTYNLPSSDILFKPDFETAWEIFGKKSNSLLLLYSK